MIIKNKKNAFFFRFFDVGLQLKFFFVILFNKNHFIITYSCIQKKLFFWHIFLSIQARYSDNFCYYIHTRTSGL